MKSQEPLESFSVKLESAGTEPRSVREQLIFLLEASDAQIVAGFQKLIAAMEIEFRQSEVRMRDLNFAELRSHQETHARLLSVFHHVLPVVMAGHVIEARQLIEFLPLWLLHHRLATVGIFRASKGRFDN